MHELRVKFLKQGISDQQSEPRGAQGAPRVRY